MSITLSQINLSTSSMPVVLTTLPSNLQLHQVSWIRFLNESPYTLTVNMGGINIPIPAWTDYPVQISVANRVLSGASLPLNINWTLLSNINNVSTVLILTFYSPGETPSSTTPVDLTRQVASDVSNATSVTNTGYANGTIFISSQVSGESAGQNPVTLTNDAKLTLGDVNFPGDIKVTGQIYTVDTNANGTTKYTDASTGFSDVIVYGNRSSPDGIAEVDLSDLSNVQRMSIRGDGAFYLVTSPVTINGLGAGGSGTLTCYQWMKGTLKIAWFVYNNFRNAQVGTQDILLPVAFTLTYKGEAGNAVKGFEIVSGGVATTPNILTALAAGGGTVTPAPGTPPVVQNNSIFYGGAFDTFRATGGNGTSGTGIVVIEGI